MSSSHRTHSEPTASALAGIFSELVLHPEHFDILRSQLAEVEDLTDFRALAAVPHLDAVINEAMRLHPAAMTGGARKTPDDQGVWIKGVFIPPKTTIFAPRYTICRRECSPMPVLPPGGGPSARRCVNKSLTSIRRGLFRARQRIHPRALDHEARDATEHGGLQPIWTW